MKPADTPRTNALLTELGLIKLAPFEQIIRDTQRHVDFTRTLERELCEAQREIERLRAAIQQTLNENGHLADGDNVKLSTGQQREEKL